MPSQVKAVTAEGKASCAQLNEIAAQSPPAAETQSAQSALEARPSQVVVLGSTGSIGRNTLEVLECRETGCELFAISGHANLSLLLEQAKRFRPHYVIVTNAAKGAELKQSDLPHGTELLQGDNSACHIVRMPEVDTVVSAMVGSVGLHATWAALEAGKKVCLANKETLVAGGPLIMALAAKQPNRLLPIDSEHSAIFQCLQAGRRGDLKRIILTASGGAFRDLSPQQLAQVTVEQALKHPTWSMGPKITIDSATLMNKALEMVEARWLFDLSADQIDAVIHPQSVVHSMVEFVDGSVLAQMSPPDMKLPIQYALTYPARVACPAPKLDFRTRWSLDFFFADEERYPALALGKEVAAAGGTAGAVMNAANEAAVDRFRAGSLRFIDIVPACRAVLHAHTFEERPSLEAIWNADRWARQEIVRWEPC